MQLGLNHQSALREALNRAYILYNKIKNQNTVMFLLYIRTYYRIYKKQNGVLCGQIHRLYEGILDLQRVIVVRYIYKRNFNTPL